MADHTETTSAETVSEQRSPAKPGARERGRMRRRLREQRRMREALLLDLGALVYELHRQGRREPELLQAKAAELSSVDAEVRALADVLDGDETVWQLVAAGIAGSCENCGSLLSTDARYCSACGAAAVPALADSQAPAPGLDEGAEASAGELDEAELQPEPEPEPEPEALEPEPEPEPEALEPEPEPEPEALEPDPEPAPEISLLPPWLTDADLDAGNQAAPRRRSGGLVGRLRRSDRGGDGPR